MLHRIHIKSRYFLHHSMLAQMVLLMFFWQIGNMIAHFFSLPIPGGIVGMLLVLICLASGRLSLFSMKRGADWLLAEMLLFFIPAVLALLDHHEFIGLLGIKILIVILCSTFVVMGVTALTIDLCCRFMPLKSYDHER